jgi:adenylate kinase family enzyme
MALIKRLSVEVKPRVVLENFPQNCYQAKFFIRNCKQPSNVFSLECSKDVCQERMISIGEGSPSYVSSAILSQKIKAYYQTAKELLPYL